LGTKLGKYSVYIHDSIYDKVRNPHSKEFYENYNVQVEFFKDEYNEKDKETLLIPLLTLGGIEKINKLYKFHTDIKMSLILFNELKNRGIILQGTCVIYNMSVRYYLNSPIGDNNIKLSNYCPDIHSISSYEDYKWLLKNGFQFNQK
jgi:hypothetical protein